jgi:hypothetical protein
LRLSEGLIFAAGVFLLGSFMAYWNYHWLLLTAFFVDWDYFGSKLFKLQPKEPAIAVQGAETDSSKDEKRTRIGIHTGFIAAYICIFLGFYVSTFAFKLGRVHLLYPFSQLDFFAEIKALEPLNEHKHFPFFMGQTAIVADGKERFVKLPRSTTRSWVGYDSGIGARSALGEGDLKQRLSSVLSAAQLVPRETYVISGERREFTPQSLSQIRLYNTLFQFPAHPAPPTMEPVHRGLLGVFDMDSGRALVAHSRSYRDRSETERYLDAFAAGFEDPEVSLWYRLDPYGREGPQPLHPLASEIVSSKSISCAGNLGVDPEDTIGESVTITLRLAGEAYAGNPHFTLYFDGRTVGSGEVDWARDTREKGRYDTSGAEIVWREITFETTYMPSAIHSLWVAYDNDAWGGPEQPGWDRNLLIDYVTVNGKSLRAEEAFYDVKGEANRSGQERLSLAGKLAFDLTCDDFPELADGQATRLTKFRFRLSQNVPDERVSSIIRIREHQDQGWYDYLGPELQ